MEKLIDEKEMVRALKDEVQVVTGFKGKGSKNGNAHMNMGHLALVQVLGVVSLYRLLTP